MNTRSLESKIAFFCVADSVAYVPKAITALASVRRFHPEAGYFVLGPFAENGNAANMIYHHGMNFRFLDLSDTFRDCEFIDTNPGRWPSECFWWTFVYKTLTSEGYTFSCTLDGDIICVNSLALDEVLVKSTAVSGVAKRNGRVNSGVLFFNHQEMENVQFFEKIVDIYRTAKVCAHDICYGYCREKGDQGLLWEIERLQGVRTRRIDNSYNHMLSLSPMKYRSKNPHAPISVSESRIIHILFKPWRPLKLTSNTPESAVDGYRAWWKFAEQLWPDAKERTDHFGVPSLDPR